MPPGWMASIGIAVFAAVEFEQAVRGAVEHGYSVFIESSPHPVLLTGIEETLMTVVQMPLMRWWFPRWP